MNLGRLIGTVYLPFAAGFFLSYTFRSVNAVLAGDIARDVGLSAGDLGLLSAAFFLAIAGFQLPLGLLLDRYGPRRVQAVLLVVAALGAFLFAAGDSASALFLARALIGLGFAGGLMAAMKAYVLWFPRERLALVNSSMMAFGGIGALAATMPADLIAANWGWRSLFVGLGLISLLVALILWLIVPEAETKFSGERLGAAIKGLAAIYGDPVFLRLAPLAIVSGSSFQALQSLWAGPWLRDVAGLDRAGIAEGLLLLAIALTAGYLLMAFVADFLSRRGVPIPTIMLVGAVLHLVVLILLAWPATVLAVPLWMALGFLGNISALSFTVLGQHFPPGLAGRATTGLNLFLFVATFTMQSAVGWVLDRFPATATGYAPEGYGVAFFGLAAIQLCGIAWFLGYGRWFSRS